MATRPPECFSPQSHVNEKIGAMRHKQQCLKTRTKLLDLAGEERESCGSNEVSLNLGNFAVGSREEKKKWMKDKNKLKANSNKSRQKTELGHQRPKIKVNTHTIIAGLGFNSISKRAVRIR